ncbi:unnamed protein product [Fraxinus pennsylvanica]|uniref:Transmembrane protein n=1 Tax=Fraxinus pennsylvanica TaxID=56036 RepID=A0AAD2E1N8_9LAMI|nr:unnamed protein product [Fraxinus pennsylvanica]
MASVYQMIISLISTLLILLFLTTKSIYADSQSSSSSIYDILESHGLPMGLFPKGISDISFNPASGRLELHLLSPSPCDAKFETSVRNEYSIMGTLAYGHILNLSGVAAQELFLWLPMKGIHVDIPSSGFIYFDVGIVFKQFSLSYFETPKDCEVTAKGDQRNDIVTFNDHVQIAEVTDSVMEDSEYKCQKLVFSPWEPAKYATLLG